jgi:UPF0716 protein FxsA
MMKWVVLLMVALPALEIWGIIRIGGEIGVMPTLLLLFVCAAAGALLAKREGRRAWLEAQRQMQSGQIPGQTLLSGLCIAAGGILLIIPGFLTDLIGLTLLFPLTRPFYVRMMLRWLEKRMRNGNAVARRW